MSQPGRDPAIDTLRGVAIAVVLLLHFGLSFGVADSWLGDVLGKTLVGSLVRNGNYGVTIFFVVSGFLITDGLLRRYGSLARVDLRRFYAERAARIGPPLLLALAIIVPLGLAGVPGFDNSDGDTLRPASFWWPAVGSVLTFWHNQLMQSAGYFNYCLNIYWSLSVEEVFYLAFPLLCLLLKRELGVAAVCCLLVTIGPVFRLVHADDEVAYLYAYPACFDAIAAGVLCALAARRRPASARWAPWLTPLLAVAMATVYLVGFAEHPAFGFTAMAGCTALFIWSCRSLPARPAASRLTAPWRWLGRHSYELYLFHIIVLALLRLVWTREQVSHAARLPLLLAFVLVSALVAAGVARWYANPLNLQWRRRLSTPPTVT